MSIEILVCVIIFLGRLISLGVEVGLTEVCGCDAQVSSSAVCYFLFYNPLNDVSIPCTSFGVVQSTCMTTVW